ncbi:HNH endonuclease [Tessaracoccus sp. ZS01]|nr:HNH endonuclease [Tessaracoccus sp. ZS01]
MWSQYRWTVPARHKFLAARRSAANRARYAKRRQRRLDRVDNDLTPAQWADLVDAWGGCAYCGQHGVPLQRDCIHPISRGGRYTLDNVVPACGSCNASKHNSEVTSWLRRKKYDERTFLLRLATIRVALLAEPTPVPPPSEMPE